MKTVSPNHPGFTYQGRMPHQGSLSTVFSFPGTSVAFNFTGDELALVLEETNLTEVNSHYNVIINGNEADPIILQTMLGEHRYVIDRSRLASRNLVLVFKRNESIGDDCHFKGILIGSGESLLEPPKLPSRKIEFYGDSVTVGQHNADPVTDSDEDKSPIHTDNYWAYSAITARNLDAQYRCIAKCGLGIIKSWYDLEAGDFFDRADSSGRCGQWDFSRWTPDVVVINLMENDRTLTAEMTPRPTDCEIIEAYSNYVSSIRAQYLRTHLVCALGSMGAVDDTRWSGYIRRAVEALWTQGGDGLSTCFFPSHPKHWLHPRINEHVTMAKILTAHIRIVAGML